MFAISSTEYYWNVMSEEIDMDFNFVIICHQEQNRYSQVPL